MSSEKLLPSFFLASATPNPECTLLNSGSCPDIVSLIIKHVSLTAFLIVLSSVASRKEPASIGGEELSSIQSLFKKPPPKPLFDCNNLERDPPSSVLDLLLFLTEVTFASLHSRHSVAPHPDAFCKLGILCIRRGGGGLSMNWNTLSFARDILLLSRTQPFSFPDLSVPVLPRLDRESCLPRSFSRICMAFFAETVFLAIPMGVSWACKILCERLKKYSCSSGAPMMATPAARAPFPPASLAAAAAAAALGARGRRKDRAAATAADDDAGKEPVLPPPPRPKRPRVGASWKRLSSSASPKMPSSSPPSSSTALANTCSQQRVSVPGPPTPLSRTAPSARSREAAPPTSASPQVARPATPTAAAPSAYTMGSAMVAAAHSCCAARNPSRGCTASRRKSSEVPARKLSLRFTKISASVRSSVSGGRAPGPGRARAWARPAAQRVQPSSSARPYQVASTSAPTPSRS
mmetsp:Transcript_13007/g.21388  ORF Transcript_13007/g.21388 Transcript_13007/m.21388 type:complete len:464 (+) Transcript_13007:1574-2965(+)